MIVKIKDTYINTSLVYVMSPYISKLDNAFGLNINGTSYVLWNTGSPTSLKSELVTEIIKELKHIIEYLMSTADKEGMTTYSVKEFFDD